MSKIITNKHNIYTLDANYQRESKSAIYIIVENQRAIIIDSGVNSSFHLLEKGLKQLGLELTSVDYLMLTHVHLDHAGGSGMIIKNCPNAKIIVHSRGARHMIDPSKLMASTISVYGQAKTHELYGNLIPIPKEKVIIADEGFTLNWQGREFVALDSPGHARHHLCYFDKTAQAIFSGDTFGLSYRDMDLPNRKKSRNKFIFPATTPTQFEPEKLVDSINRIVKLQPIAAYLTHFGMIDELPQQAESLINHINKSVQIAQKYQNSQEDKYLQIKSDLQDYFLTEAKKYGTILSENEILAIWEDDLKLNAQGLTYWIDHNN